MCARWRLTVFVSTPSEMPEDSTSRRPPISDYAALSIEVRAGQPLVFADGKPLATFGAVLTSEGGLAVEFLNWTLRDGCLSGIAGEIQGQFSLEMGHGLLVIRGSLSRVGAGLVRLRQCLITLRDIHSRWSPVQGSPCALKMAYCGAHSRSPHSRSGTELLPPGARLRGWWVGAVAPQRGGPAFVLGGLDFRRFATAVDMTATSITAVQHLELAPLLPATAFELPALWLGVSPHSPLEALERYACDVARTHNVSPRASPCGWGSWGHFLESIDADLMRENLIALNGSVLLRDVVRIVQIDDGWSELLESERASASWRPNRRFPSGIAPLAEAVRRSGRDCGLWILPFTVNEGSPLALAHPEYLVRGADGQPQRVGGGESFCLDPFHPGARAWLADLLSRVREWGVAYVKLDHLRALLMPDPDTVCDDLDVLRSHARPATRVEAYRRGLEVVREAVGSSVFIVGCSAPGGPSIGLVDAHRIGPDIEPSWLGAHSGIRDATRALAANFFWQGRTWVNDPDYLLAGATVEESRFWATAVALSGGSSVVSADLGDLPRWQEEMFAMVTPPTGRSARPLDLFENAPEPRLWHVALGGSADTWHIIGLFNWDENPTHLTLELSAFTGDGPAHVWDVWRARHHVTRGPQRWYVEGHSAALLAVRAVRSHPQLVGTSIHFAQGAGILDGERWDAESSRLSLEVRDPLPRPGVAYVWCPDSWRCDEAALAVDARNGLLQMPLIIGGVSNLQFSQSVLTSTVGEPRAH